MRGFSVFSPDLGSLNLDAETLAQIMQARRSWWVDEVLGSDSNGGSSADPFKTLAAAIDAAGTDDVVVLVGSAHVTTTVLWNKDAVNLVGIRPPSGSPRKVRAAIAAVLRRQSAAALSQSCCLNRSAARSATLSSVWG